MAKTTKSVKARRASSIERCIADAEDFLQVKKAKKITKTKSMVRTIEEGRHIVNPRKVAPKPKKVARKPKRPTRPAVRALPAPAPVVPSVPPVSAGTKIVRARSLDKSIKPSKATIFKTGSKDLPMPAFGFIDVCFCVDATGSMSS